MDKQIYYARQRPSASDLNADISNTENYGQDIVNNLVLGSNTILNGLLGHITLIPSEMITVDIGLAYQSNGKKVNVPVIKTLKWDGTNGQPAHASFDRIDIVCVRHTYVDGDVVPRYFIDSNPASPTFGQQITQNVVVNRTDGYEFFVQTGTPSATPNIPAAPSGYIPLCLVYVRRNPVPPYYPTIGTGGLHYGAWNTTVVSDIDNNHFRDSRRVSQTLEDALGKKYIIPIGTGVIAAPMAQTTPIVVDWTLGDIWAVGHTGATLEDYLVDIVSSSVNEPIYGPNDTAPHTQANFIFGKITNETPGSETVTFYMGDPYGVHAVSMLNVGCILTYPQHIAWDRIPPNFLRTQFLIPIVIDQAVQARLNYLETTGVDGNLFTLNADDTAAQDLYLRFGSASGINKYLKWVNSTSQFLFNAPVEIQGTSLHQFTTGANAGYEIGDSSLASGLPYIDFHFGISGSESYNVRLQNNLDNVLTLSGGLTVNVPADMAAGEATLFTKVRDASVARRYTFNDVGGVIGDTSGAYWRGLHLAAPAWNTPTVTPRLSIFAEYDTLTGTPTTRKWVFNASNDSSNPHIFEYRIDDIARATIESAVSGIAGGAVGIQEVAASNWNCSYQGQQQIWKFNNTGAFNPTISYNSGGSYNLTANGAPVWNASGKLGYCTTLDGAAQGWYVADATALRVLASTDFLWCGWVRLHTVPGAGVRNIFHKWWSAGVDTAYALQITSTGKLRFTYGTNPGPATNLDSTDAFPVNIWTFVWCRRTGGSTIEAGWTPDTTTIYDTSTKLTGAGITQSFGVSGIRLTIGNDNANAAGWDGELDQIEFMNGRYYTDTEMTYLFNNGNGTEDMFGIGNNIPVAESGKNKIWSSTNDNVYVSESNGIQDLTGGVAIGLPYLTANASSPATANIHATRWTALANRVLRYLSVYLCDTPPQTAQIVMGIYEHNTISTSSQPTTRLGYTRVYTVKDSDDNRCVMIPLVSPVAIEFGKEYWITFQASANIAVGYSDPSPSASDSIYIARTWDATMPTTWPNAASYASMPKYTFAGF